MIKNRQYYKFCIYGFLKNLRFFDAFFVLFLIGKGLSFTHIGILYAVREIFINIFEIPSGIIADTYGRKNSLAASLFCYIISFCVFYISNSFWIFLAAFIIYGIGDAFRTGTHKGMIMDYLRLNKWEDEKIIYYGHTRSWSQKGSAISSLIAGLIVFYSGNYVNIFLYSAIPYLLNLLLILFYPKDLNYSLKQINHKNRPEIKSTIKSFIIIISQPKVLKIANSSAVFSAYLKAVKDYIQPLMVNIALITPVLLNIEAEKKNGIIIGLIYFFIYLLTSYASKSSARIVEKNKTNISNFTLLAGFASGILCGIFFVYELWTISLIAFAGIYLIENIRKPILTGFISDNVPNEILTSVISAQSLLKTLVTAILAPIIGIIADSFGIGISILVISTLLSVSTLLINARTS